MPVDASSRPAPLRLAPLWWALGWAFVALVTYLSLTPSPPPPQELLGFDIAHAAAYAWLMFWFAHLLPTRAARLRCALALCALGILLEFLQGASGYRVLSYADMRDDAIGVAIGALVASTGLARVLPSIDAALAASLGRARG